MRWKGGDGIIRLIGLPAAISTTFPFRNRSKQKYVISARRTLYLIGTVHPHTPPPGVFRNPSGSVVQAGNRGGLRAPEDKSEEFRPCAGISPKVSAADIASRIEALYLDHWLLATGDLFVCKQCRSHVAVAAAAFEVGSPPTWIPLANQLRQSLGSDADRGR